MNSRTIKIINDYQKHTEWLIAQVKEKNEEIKRLREALDRKGDSQWKR